MRARWGKTGQNPPSFIRGSPVRGALQGKYVNQVKFFITLKHAQFAMGCCQMGPPSSVMTSHLPPTQNPQPNRARLNSIITYIGYKANRLMGSNNPPLPHPVYEIYFIEPPILTLEIFQSSLFF